MIAVVRWFLANYLVLNAVCFVWRLVWGATLTGDERPYVRQRLGLVHGGRDLVGGRRGDLPFLPHGCPDPGGALVVWWFASNAVGHPRLIAYLLAAIVCLSAVVLIPNAGPVNVAPHLFLPTFAYATIARRPAPRRRRP